MRLVESAVDPAGVLVTSRTAAERGVEDLARVGSASSAGLDHSLSSGLAGVKDLAVEASNIDGAAAVVSRTGAVASTSNSINIDRTLSGQVVQEVAHQRRKASGAAWSVSIAAVLHSLTSSGIAQVGLSIRTVTSAARIKVGGLGLDVAIRERAGETGNGALASITAIATTTIAATAITATISAASETAFDVGGASAETRSSRARARASRQALTAAATRGAA